MDGLELLKVLFFFFEFLCQTNTLVTKGSLGKRRTDRRCEEEEEGCVFKKMEGGNTSCSCFFPWDCSIFSILCHAERTQGKHPEV